MLGKKSESKKFLLDHKKNVLEREDDLSNERTSLIVSNSLFGDSRSRAFRRLSLVCDNNPVESIKSGLSKNVLVPNWRMVSFKPIYKLEGTENLNDEYYLKRHQKHENEERLIKKRDLRRQKEEFLKFKMLNRNRVVLANKNDKNKANYNIDNELKKKIIEKNGEVNLEG